MCHLADDDGVGWQNVKMRQSQNLDPKIIPQKILEKKIKSHSTGDILVDPSPTATIWIFFRHTAEVGIGDARAAHA